MKTKDVAVESNFMRERGLEMAKFLVWLVENLDIPPVSAQGGGIALLGWSIGNVTTMAMLRFLPTFPNEVRDVVISYLRAFIVYGASFVFIIALCG